MIEVGKTYTTRCFGDSQLNETWEIIKRTPKTITAKSDTGEIKTAKIRLIDGVECVQLSKGFSFIRGE